MDEANNQASKIFTGTTTKKLFHQVILLNKEIPPPFSVGLTIRLDLQFGS